MRQVRDSRIAPHSPKSPIKKIIIPIKIIKNADISMDEKGKVVKLNRWITYCTAGRIKNKRPRTIRAAPLN